GAAFSPGRPLPAFNDHGGSHCEGQVLTASVGTERYTRDEIFLPARAEQHLSAFLVPDSHSPVEKGGRQVVGLRTECQCDTSSKIPTCQMEFLARLRVPDTDRTFC